MSKHEQIKYLVGIVGYGYVGKAMHHLFPEAVIYDKYQTLYADDSQKSKVNQCDVVFVCVPTDAKNDGSVDLSAVADVASWLTQPQVVIKSTVPASKVFDIEVMFNGGVVFNPEFMTEKNWKKDVENENRIILGAGDLDHAKLVARLYQKVYGQDVAYLYTTPEMAMMVKYVSNAFLATKVTFCNEIHDICAALGLDYDQLRELWLHDKRVGRTHTLVTDQRGFGGYCLPKDLAGLITTAQEAGNPAHLLSAIQTYNDRVRDKVNV